MTALSALAAEFWQWRSTTQPDSFDDITRVPRPPRWLPDWSAESVRDRQDTLAELTARHQSLPVPAESIDEQVDHILLESALGRVHWELNLLRSWQRNPCFYLDQSLLPVYHQLLAPPPFDGARAVTIVSCLAAVPQVLADARTNLADHAAAPFAECAVKLLTRAATALRAAMAALAPMLPPAQREALPSSADAACRALVELRDWLTDRASTFTPTTHVGTQMFDFFLHRVALLPYSVATMRNIGHLEHARYSALELAVRTRTHGAPPQPLLPDTASQIARQYHDELTVRAWYRQHGFLHLPAGLRHYRNVAMPAYLAPLAWLGVPHHLGSPTEPHEDAVRYVPVPEEDLPYFQLAEARDPRVGIAHEGVHAWQTALSWLHPNPSRRHYYDSAPNEGIAFANEELLLAAGLFDDAPDSARFLVNAMRLRALRVEIDIGLALGDLTIESAADRLAESVPMDYQTAWSEAVFFAGNPGQGLSYQIGKTQVFDLMRIHSERSRSGGDLPTIQAHLWRNGNVPIALQRWELLGLSDHIDAVRTLA